MTADLSEEARAVLSPLLAEALFEIIPLPGAVAEAEVLPQGTKVSVTSSPKAGPEETVAAAEELAGRGLRVTPHLAARRFRDRTHLRAVLDRLVGAGFEEIFVVGGDGEPVGRFDDALSLLREIADAGASFPRVGVACYPEGHPDIPDEVLLAALREKQPLATHMTSQMCFDPEAIARWLKTVRGEGVDLPLWVGVPGVVDTGRLIKVAARIGVGGSLRFLMKHRRVVAGLVRGGGYDPTGLVAGLVPLVADPTAAVEGFHLFTFNQVAATEQWRRSLLGPPPPAGG